MLCIGVLLLPLLLLTTPGRAVPRPDGAARHGDGRSVALGASPKVQLVVHTSRLRPRSHPGAASAAALSPEMVPTTVVTTTEPPVTATEVAPVTTVPVVTAAPTTTTTSPPGHHVTGIATWYPAPAGTCASAVLPSGAEVTVTDLADGRSVTCLVDDYETAPGRLVDIAESTFVQLTSLGTGVMEVGVTW
jgi:rare lipoprotein A (peptidoglycan hydrolase)